MRYVMKQKLWSWGADFTIKDDAGRDHFFVDGKALSIGDKLSFQDMAGNELAFIRQKLLSWGPTYEIYHGGQLAAVVKQKLWTLFRNRFTVDVDADGPGPGDLLVQGDFWAHEYNFAREPDGQPVATVSKRWFTWTDTYGVEIAPGQDDVLILACTVVVDMATQKRKNDD
ncbi:MAG TPA: LURP-one-related family protein [Tepidisphaeraceae bacterium]|jgi:uncharacterized protein YxjI